MLLSRDLDGRISPRESAAVAEWLQSKKPLHVMRDNPFHKKAIMGENSKEYSRSVCSGLKLSCTIYAYVCSMTNTSVPYLGGLWGTNMTGEGTRKMWKQSWLQIMKSEFYILGRNQRQVEEPDQMALKK